MPDDLDYCRDKAAPAGSNLYYAVLFDTGTLKKQILPLFALHYEITGSLTASMDPGVNRIKLQWWFEELARLSVSGSRHPVTLSLQQAGYATDTTISLLRQYLTTIESISSGRSTAASIDAWYTSLIRGLGQLWIAASNLDDGVPPETRSMIGSSGGTIFLLELVQNSFPLFSRGYPLYPDVLLEQYGLSIGDLTAPASAKSTLPLFRMLIDRITSQLDADYPAWKQNGHAVWYGRILNRLARATCDEIRRDGYQILQHRIALTPIRKLWISVRTRYFG